MQFKKYTKEQMPFLALLAIAFVFTSCGSYQHVAEDNDGIYGSTEVPVEQTTDVAPDNSNNSYYKNYFQEKSTEYDYITDENEIFTDIDSYEGDYVEQDTTEKQSYAGWGQDSNDVTINVYSNFGGYGYNNWYRPYRYGYSPYWNTGWGYSGFYDPFWCSPYYGYGYGYGGYYNSPYWNNYGYNNYYGRNSVAYHSTRRGNSLNRYNTISRRNTTNALSRRNTIRPRVNSSTRPRTNTTPSPRPRVKPNTTPRPRVNPNTSTPRPRTNTSSSPRPRTNTYSSPKPRSNSSSTSSPRRSNSSSGSSAPSRRGRR